MDGRETRTRECRGEEEGEEETIYISDGLYLNYLGSIHTWDKHCHPKGLSHRHLTGTLYTARESRGRHIRVEEAEAVKRGEGVGEGGKRRNLY